MVGSTPICFRQQDTGSKLKHTYTFINYLGVHGMLDIIYIFGSYIVVIAKLSGATMSFLHFLANTSINILSAWQKMIKKRTEC